MLGNNDYTRDYDVPLTDAGAGPNPWFSFLSAPWAAATSPPQAGQEWSPLDDLETFRAGGYGMRRLSAQLYLVTLNTVVYSPRFPNAPGRDPFGQLAWLDRTLGWLERQGAGAGAAKALITGHIPPGIDSWSFEPLWSERFAERYARLAARHDRVISAQLFAHQHCDTFRLLPASLGVTHPVFVASAVSPVYVNNPSFRVWRYEGTELLDYTAYAADLEAGPQERLRFAAWPSARDAYGLLAQTAAEWRTRVAERLAKDDAVWARYLRSTWQRTSGPELAAAMASPGFRAKTACSVLHFLRADFEACAAAAA